VEASAAIDGVPPGQNLAKRLPFKQTSQGVWTLALEKPIEQTRSLELTVSAKDHQGNRSLVQRSILMGDLR
jgi:hypothetical protein